MIENNFKGQFGKINYKKIKNTKFSTRDYIWFLKTEDDHLCNKQ